MSRKHYKAFAAMMAERRPEGNAAALALWNAIVLDLAMICKHDNANFDGARFRAACEG